MNDAGGVGTAAGTVRTVGTSRAPNRTELLVLGAVTLFTCAGTWVEAHYATWPVPPVAGALLLTLAAAATLVARRRHPDRVAVACLLAVLAYHLLGYEGFAPEMLLYVACYAVGAYGGQGRGRGRRQGRGRDRWRWRLTRGLAIAACAWAVPALPPHAVAWYSFDVSIPALGLAVAVGVGESARRRREDAEDRVRRSAALAGEHTARRLAEERLRIARELHDVLAHTISVVAVQSGVALDTLDDDPAQARAAMLAVRGAARQALPELRAALDLLRGAGGAPVRPQPGLDRLPELVARIRESGLAVDVVIDVAAAESEPESEPESGAESGAESGSGSESGSESVSGSRAGSEAGSESAPESGYVLEISPLVQLTAYRIIQESLTNALRHAAADRAAVTVRRVGAELDIEVVDDGRGAAAVPGASVGPIAAATRASGMEAPGFGLLGMRERVEAVGGTLDAGPRSGVGGGFRVAARLPLSHRFPVAESEAP